MVTGAEANVLEVTCGRRSECVSCDRKVDTKGSSTVGVCIEEVEVKGCWPIGLCSSGSCKWCGCRVTTSVVVELRAAAVVYVIVVARG